MESSAPITITAQRVVGFYGENETEICVRLDLDLAPDEVWCSTLLQACEEDGLRVKVGEQHLTVVTLLGREVLDVQAVTQHMASANAVRAASAGGGRSREDLLAAATQRLVEEFGPVVTQGAR